MSIRYGKALFSACNQNARSCSDLIEQRGGVKPSAIGRRSMLSIDTFRSPRLIQCNDGLDGGIGNLKLHALGQQRGTGAQWLDLPERDEALADVQAHGRQFSAGYPKVY